MLCATFSGFQEVLLLPPSPPLPLPRVLGSQFLSCFDCNSLTSPFGQKPRLAPSRPSGSQPHSHHCGKRLEPGLSPTEVHRQAGPTEGAAAPVHRQAGPREGAAAPGLWGGGMVQPDLPNLAPRFGPKCLIPVSFIFSILFVNIKILKYLQQINTRGHNKLHC